MNAAELLKPLQHAGAEIWLRASFVVLAGSLLTRMASFWTRRLVQRRFTSHHAVLAGRTVSYAGFAIVFVLVLHELGFSLAPLLGAAGVLGVAIGFASQTSLSNLISGLFLVAEEPFKIGELVQVGSTVGEVIAIDALSVKLRTFDNKLVRLPNESLLKTEVANFTRFPIRRIDLQFGVAYKEDVTRVRRILEDIARAHPSCLDDPAPVFIHRGFGASSLDLQFSVWVRRENFLEARNALFVRIKRRFDEEGVEIPFPQRSVYTAAHPPAAVYAPEDPFEAGRAVVRGEDV